MPRRDAPGSVRTLAAARCVSTAVEQKPFADLHLCSRHLCRCGSRSPGEPDGTIHKRGQREERKTNKQTWRSLNLLINIRKKQIYFYWGKTKLKVQTQLSHSSKMKKVQVQLTDF